MILLIKWADFETELFQWPKYKSLWLVIEMDRQKNQMKL